MTQKPGEFSGANPAGTYKNRPKPVPHAPVSGLVKGRRVEFSEPFCGNFDTDGTLLTSDGERSEYAVVAIEREWNGAGGVPSGLDLALTDRAPA
jgi:hypothetical protein